MMKKILVCAACLACLFCLASCKDGAEPFVPSYPSEESSETSGFRFGGEANPEDLPNIDLGDLIESE